MSARLFAHQIIEQFAAQRPLRAGSFIITLYGDAILPRHGEVWMGDIINLCKEVGINESLVRTAVSRLVASNRITGSKIGRKSYYKLTEESRKEFQHASEQIYSPPFPNSDIWTFVMNLSTQNREDLKRKMEKIGFGDPIHGLFLKPGNCHNELYYIFGDSLKDYAGLSFTAYLNEVETQLKDISKLTDGWHLDLIGAQYENFICRFEALHNALLEKNDLVGLEQLLIRQILVHEYRRIIFKDPRLPENLLPSGWTGVKAFTIFRDLYDMLANASEAYISEKFENDHDSLTANPELIAMRLHNLKKKKPT